MGVLELCEKVRQVFKMASGLLLLFVTVGLAAVVIGQEYDLPDDCGPCDPEKCVNPVKCPAGRTLDR